MPNDLHNNVIGPASVSAEQIAEVVAGIPTVEAACLAIREAGWLSSVAGNRITVNDRVFARLIAEPDDSDADVTGKWLIYGIGDQPPVRIVDAVNQQASEPMSNGSCAETT